MFRCRYCPDCLLYVYISATHAKSILIAVYTVVFFLIVFSPYVLADIYWNNISIVIGIGWWRRVFLAKWKIVYFRDVQRQSYEIIIPVIQMKRISIVTLLDAITEGNRWYYWKGESDKVLNLAWLISKKNNKSWYAVL